MNLSSAISEASVKSIFMRLILCTYLFLLAHCAHAQESALWSQLEGWYDLTDSQTESIKHKCDSLLQQGQLSAYEKTFTYHILSDCYYFLNDMRSSDNAVIEAIKHMPEDYDTARQILIYNAHGQNQFSLGKKEKAIDIFHKGLAIAKQTKDTLSLAFFYDNIANSFLSLSEQNKSTPYLDSAMICYFAVADSSGILSILDKQAGNLKLNEDYESADNLYRSGFQFVPSTEPEWRDMLNLRLGTLYQMSEEYDSIKIYLDKINNSSTGYVTQDVLLGKFSLNAFYDLAQKDTLNAISNFDSCALVAYKIGNQFEYLQCRLQAEIYKAPSKENEQAMMRTLKEIDSMEMKRLARVGYDILARKQTHLGNMREAYKNLRKSVELSYELNRKTTQQEIAKLSVAYELKEKELQLQISKEREQARTKQLISYGITFGSLALLLLGLLQYRNRRTKHKLEKEKLQQEKSLIQEISNLESKAFRAQMNPHFIFNALNSIKGLVIQQKTEKAADYISDFSKLMRSILENSMSKTISLQNELETLERYIKLEQMRFQGNFHYEIDIEEDLDIDHIMVPPIIVQPFVENAIWHGFSDRKENNRLLVRIYADEELHIIVDDNGVGRAIKQDHKVQKSYGVSITQQRIWNFSGDEKRHRMLYTDKNLAKHQESGTMVSISLPIKYKH